MSKELTTTLPPNIQTMFEVISKGFREGHSRVSIAIRGRRGTEMRINHVLRDCMVVTSNGYTSVVRIEAIDTITFLGDD